MDLPRNPVKAAFRDGRATVGLWSMLPHPWSVEALATCGFDWLLIDTEHTAVTLPQVMGLMQAAASGGTAVAVRPGSPDPVEIKRLLDLGAQTLVVPYIQSVAEARAAVAAVRYPPQGIRGVSVVSRASGFGRVADYTARANEEICLILQLETLPALALIEEVAAIEGVDGIFIGPADLAASMGHPGRPDAPAVRTAVLDGIARIAAAGKAPGLLSADQDLMRQAAAAGSLFNGVGVDTGLLLGAARQLRGLWPRAGCQPRPAGAKPSPGAPL